MTYDTDKNKSHSNQQPIYLVNSTRTRTSRVTNAQKKLYKSDKDQLSTRTQEVQVKSYVALAEEESCDVVVVVEVTCCVFSDDTKVVVGDCTSRIHKKNRQDLKII